MMALEQQTVIKQEPIEAMPQNTAKEEEANKQSKAAKRGRRSKCKKCDFTSFDKDEYWIHIRSHIPVEKQIQCPLCLFVTEFKHHFEFHLNNHNGTKPFTCDICDYKCNNKSMLTSHRKSHSNIYQYTCRDCEFASKYLHQLKAHLKRMMHRPNYMLNPDGSINYTQVIDVYGKKRGPKAKPGQQQQQVIVPQQPQELPATLQGVLPPSPPQVQVPVPQMPSLPFNFSVNPAMMPFMTQYMAALTQIQLAAAAVAAQQQRQLSSPTNMYMQSPAHNSSSYPSPVSVSRESSFDEVLDLSMNSERRRSSCDSETDSGRSSPGEDSNNNRGPEKMNQ